MSTVDINDIPQAVHAELRAFFDAQKPVVAEIDPFVARAVEKLEDMVLGGGKRMRPLFAWAGFQGALQHQQEAEREDPKAVLKAVSALELIQACALIHDDIIDASDTRRGVPTVHRRVESDHVDEGWHGSAAKFGESVAILIGDLALAWADDMMLDSGLSPAAIARVREPWRAMRSEVIAGQILDITLEASGDERIELAHKVNRFKTAAYTIERPLHIGAAIADASPEIVKAYRDYGTDIGIAFQLRDDLLGVFGDPSITGKPAGDDLREGKRTELLGMALENLDEDNPAAARRLRERVGVAVDATEIQELALIIGESGAPERVEKRIAELTDSGLKNLEIDAISPQVRELLRDLAVKATKRHV